MFDGELLNHTADKRSYRAMEAYIAQACGNCAEGLF